MSGLTPLCSPAGCFWVQVPPAAAAPDTGPGWQWRTLQIPGGACDLSPPYEGRVSGCQRGAGLSAPLCARSPDTAQAAGATGPQLQGMSLNRKPFQHTQCKNRNSWAPKSDWLDELDRCPGPMGTLTPQLKGTCFLVQSSAFLQWRLQRQQCILTQ